MGMSYLFVLLDVIWVRSPGRFNPTSPAETSVALWLPRISTTTLGKGCYECPQEYPYSPAPSVLLSSATEKKPGFDRSCIGSESSAVDRLALLCSLNSFSVYCFVFLRFFKALFETIFPFIFIFFHVGFWETKSLCSRRPGDACPGPCRPQRGP